ncbi:MAG TPA: class I adenylate-forming enzyme family protein [Bacilli bacterium]|nr:class I adenylate-forming enzyme family protein [Bacilli bacterium]HPS18806.1 class I adenylate-forming enzyme family protein [Bacilli bacterium]
MFENLSLYEAFQLSVKNTPSGKAVYYQGTQMSYRRLSHLVDRMADILVHRLNVKRNDVILVAQPNIPDTLILVYALNKIGAIANLVHPFTPYNQIRNIMEKTKTKIAIMFEQRVAKEVEKYREIADRIYVTRVEDYLPIAKKNIYHLFMNRDIRKKLGRFRGKFKGFRYLYQLKPTGLPVETVTGKSKEISVYLHSGSTTGEPKIICLCDENFNFICDQTDVAASLPREQLKYHGMLSVLPSFHGFGFCMTMHNSLTNSMNCILIPKFSPKEVVKTMKKTKVSLCVGVPTMYESLINYPPFVKSKKLKNWFVCFSGGDTLSADLKTRFDEVMKAHGSPCQVFEGYGLTESVAAISINTFAHNRLGSIGYPLNDVSIRIVDEKGQEIPRGEIGEITIKSKATMVCYLNDPEATKKAVVDGWLYTGDLGYVDQDNYLFFKLRKKRVIKVSGVGVFPTEIEALINHVPGVKGCCAIRIPDPRLQSAVKVFVVADYFDEQGMKNEIIETCRKYLIRWAVPKEIEFIEKLPMTMLNKVNFAKLQKEEDERRHLEG